MSYGTTPAFKEFGPDGNHDVRMTVRYGEDGHQMDYRVYKQEWHATPSYPPAVAVMGQKGYVSWNGATEVTGYQIHAGKSKNKLHKIATIKKKGFETQFHVPKAAHYVMVAAYDGKKHLRNSKVHQVHK